MGSKTPLVGLKDFHVYFLSKSTPKNSRPFG